jgi:elongation factor Ts
MVTTEQIKELRERTNISVMQCKKALEEADGDMEKALILLRKKGSEIASKKTERGLGAGVIASYVHSDSRIGVLVEVLCETDFVAKNNEFRSFAEDLAMHVAAMNPTFLKKEEITEDAKEKARDVFAGEVGKMDKPEEVKKTILDGKLDSYFKEKVLLSQPFIKDTELTIQGLVEQVIQKTGERIEISRFTRFELLKE